VEGSLNGHVGVDLNRGDNSSPAVASSSPAPSPLLLMRLCEWLRPDLAAEVSTSTEATGGLSPLSSCVASVELC